MLEFFISLIFLSYQSFFDLKSKEVKNKLSWAMFYVGLGFAVMYSLVNPIYFVEWLIGIVIVGLFFYFIKKWFPNQFGSGDFWVLIALQSLNPMPFIGSTFVVFSLAAVLLFVYSIKTGKEIGFLPFLAIAYLLFSSFVWFAF